MKTRSENRIKQCLMQFACYLPFVGFMAFGSVKAVAEEGKTQLQSPPPALQQVTPASDSVPSNSVEPAEKAADAMPAGEINIQEKKDLEGVPTEGKKEETKKELPESAPVDASPPPAETDKKESNPTSTPDKKTSVDASAESNKPSKATKEKSEVPVEEKTKSAVDAKKGPENDEKSPAQKIEKEKSDDKKEVDDEQEELKPEQEKSDNSAVGEASMVEMAKDKANKEKAAKAKAEKEKANKEKAAKFKAGKQKAAKAKLDKEKADKARADQEKADKEKAEKEKADKEKADKEKADKEKATKATPAPIGQSPKTAIPGAQIPGAQIPAPQAAGKENVVPPLSTKRAVKISPVKGKNPTIIDLQSAALTSSIDIRRDQKKGRATLYNLNPQINVWYLIKLEWDGDRIGEFYHVENVFSAQNRLTLERDFDKGLVITRTGGTGPSQIKCPLWSDGADYELRKARAQKIPYSPVCGDLLYIRNTIEGYRTTKEWVVEFLRDNVWGGETVTDLVKKTLFKDKYLVGSANTTEAGESGGEGKLESALIPRDALVAPAFRNEMLETKELAIRIEGRRPDELPLGKWHQTTEQSGIFLSIMQAKFIDPKVLESYSDYVSKLDAVESNATSYLIAFDLAKFDLKFALGTEHPRLNWSTRTLQEMIVPGTKGPDGIDSTSPLVVTGLVNSVDSKDIIATFTGGFKRSHSAFKWGELSKINYGSHYGFIENGIVFSSLNPYLATITVDGDGHVSLRTWGEDDDYLSQNIRFARQNGVPVIEYDKEHQISKPGQFVSNWTKGNWSGSNDQKFRALRAGVCMQRHLDHNFLIYGYFSSVTPAAMARIFQAYQCEYAMHLDMNAPEHTYLAIYTEQGKNGGRIPEQLTSGMRVLDERFQGNVPRFIGYPDNRDFFYLIRKNQQ